MPADNLRGILLMLASMALFGIEDMFLKMATAGLPTGQIIFVSGALGLPVFLILTWRQKQKVWTRSALHKAVIARNIGEMLASIAYITALATVPLATVSAVLQALPLAATMAAALFMQEQVGWRRWVAGDVLLQLHTITLPDDIAAGEYPLAVGAYTRGDRRRLVVNDGRDMVELTHIVVVDDE